MAKRHLTFLIFLALAVILTRINGFTGVFIYDDRTYIQNNPQVTDGASIFGSPTPPDRSELGLYRPVTVATYRFNHFLGGLKPSLFHGTNFLIHMLVCFALYALVVQITRPDDARGGAFLAALLFAVHPANTESVSWIVGRAELLSALFCLMAASAHLAARNRARSGGAWRGGAWRGGAWRGGAWRGMVYRGSEAFCFVLAVLSKENAFVFPLVLWILDRFVPTPDSRPEEGDAVTPPKPRRSMMRLLRVSLRDFWIYLPLTAGLLLLRFMILDRLSPDIKTAPFRDVGLLERIPASFSLLAEYFKLFYFPVDLRIFYHIDEFRSLTAGRIITLVLVGALILWLWRKRHPLTAWLLWFPAALIPVLNLVPIGAVFAERFFYLPSMGLCVFVGLGLIALVRVEQARWKTHFTLWIPAMTVIVFAVLSVARNPVFASDESLWRDAKDKCGNYAYPHYNLGESLAGAGKWEYQSPENQGAVRELNESLKIRRDHPYAFSAHWRLGTYYLNVRYPLAAQKGLVRKTRECLQLAAYHLERAITSGPIEIETKRKPAMLLAGIPLYEGGEAFVSIKRALLFLDLAESYGAPPEQTRPLRQKLLEAREAASESREVPPDSKVRKDEEK